MDDAELLELATGYWADPGGDDWAELLEHASGNSPELPRVLAALVTTLPAHRELAYIGTGPIEDLYSGGASGEEVLRVLRQTGLDSSTIATILSGVYPDMLEQMGMRATLTGFLPSPKIEWLLDRSAPGRGDYL